MATNSDLLQHSTLAYAEPVLLPPGLTGCVLSVSPQKSVTKPFLGFPSFMLTIKRKQVPWLLDHGMFNRYGLDIFAHIMLIQH